MRSDEPGFRNPLPTGMLMGHQDGQTAPGSVSAGGQANGLLGGPIIGQARVDSGDPYASIQDGSPMVDVSTVASQSGMYDPMRDPVSGQVQVNTAGKGHVVTANQPGDRG